MRHRYTLARDRLASARLWYASVAMAPTVCRPPCLAHGCSTALSDMTILDSTACCDGVRAFLALARNPTGVGAATAATDAVLPSMTTP